MKIGLALSGGGFRATLFHIGVVQYLQDAGLLNKVKAIASSSGGSLVAAMLALQWDRVKKGDFSSSVKQPLVTIARAGLRERIVRRIPWLWMLRATTRGRLQRRLPTSPTRLLAQYYDRYLFSGATLDDVRTHCDDLELLVLATNVSRGGINVFGTHSVRFLPPNLDGTAEEVAAGLTPLGVAVAASSAFPALFPPIMLDHLDIGAEEADFTPQWFTDAGVSDNLAVDSLMRLRDDIDLFIVSDAGRSRVPPKAQALGLLTNALRASDLMLFRISELARERASGADASRIACINISDETECVPGQAAGVVQRPLAARGETAAMGVAPRHDAQQGRRRG